eukprot:scaffold492_cov257-Pinguiococcus_pyrenoidosus.AAC.25
MPRRGRSRRMKARLHEEVLRPLRSLRSCCLRRRRTPSPRRLSPGHPGLRSVGRPSSGSPRLHAGGALVSLQIRTTLLSCFRLQRLDLGANAGHDRPGEAHANADRRVRADADPLIPRNRPNLSRARLRSRSPDRSPLPASSPGRCGAPAYTSPASRALATLLGCRFRTAKTEAGLVPPLLRPALHPRPARREAALAAATLDTPYPTRCPCGRWQEGPDPRGRAPLGRRYPPTWTSS